MAIDGEALARAGLEGQLASIEADLARMARAVAASRARLGDPGVADSTPYSTQVGVVVADLLNGVNGLGLSGLIRAAGEADVIRATWNTREG